MKLKTLTIFSIVVISNYSLAQTVLIFKASFEFVSQLNDTGITWAGESPSGNNVDCTSSTITPPQDCNTGRDVTHNNDSDGHAGFSFTKLGADGDPLIDQSDDFATTPWACVRDNVTGLFWEMKTDDGGLHDIFYTYNWYNTDSTTNGGADGYADDDGAICYGYNNSDSSTFCNTQAYTARINAQGLCGQTDWRMPDINELHSIVHQGRVNPAIDKNYFPNTPSSWFWSSSPFTYNSSLAWGLGFYYGSDSRYSRNFDYYVRLVRGGQ